MYLKSKIIFVTFFFASSTNILQAQLSIGAQGGLNSALLVLSNKAPEAKLSFNNGFVFGTIFNYELNKSFSLQSEPRFIQKGERAQLHLGSINTDTKLYYNYLELPIYLVTTLAESQFEPFLLGGVNVGYLVKVKAESVFNGKEETFDLTDDFKKMDITFDVGAGLKYNIDQSTSLLMNVRYSYGIYNISKTEGSVNTRGIQFLLGMLFDL